MVCAGCLGAFAFDENAKLRELTEEEVRGLAETVPGALHGFLFARDAMKQIMEQSGRPKGFRSLLEEGQISIMVPLGVDAFVRSVTDGKHAVPGEMVATAVIPEALPGGRAGLHLVFSRKDADGKVTFEIGRVSFQDMVRAMGECCAVLANMNLADREEHGALLSQFFGGSSPKPETAH